MNSVAPPENVPGPSGVRLDASSSQAETPSSVELPLTIIERRPGWHFVNVREMWRGREVLYYLAWRDIKVRYKQTALGVTWAFAQPLFAMLVFTLFLGNVAGLGGGVENYALFVFAGMLPWTFFSSAVSQAGNSIIANERLITKVYFPRLLVPFSSVGSVLVRLRDRAAVARGHGSLFWRDADLESARCSARGRPDDRDRHGHRSLLAAA